MARPRWLTETETRFLQIGDAFLIEGRVVNATTGVPLAPSAATITITRRGGGDLSTPVSGASMTIAGEYLSYTLASGVVTAPERYLQAAIAVTIGSDTYTLRHFFDACRVAPVMTADISDVAIGAPGLEYLATQEDPSAQEVHREAWDVVLEWLRAVAGWPDLLLDHAALKQGHIYKTRELLYARNVRTRDDASAIRAEDNRKLWDKWSQRTALAFDRDRSGEIDSDEEPQSVALVPIGRREADNSSPGLTGFRRY